MANAGLSDELKQLFSSVADDLGWLNIDETEKGLSLENEVPANKLKEKLSKDKTKKKANGRKKKTTRRRNQSSKSEDLASVQNGKDDFLNTGAEKLLGNGCHDKQTKHDNANQRSITPPGHNIPDGNTSNSDVFDSRKTECSPPLERHTKHKTNVDNHQIQTCNTTPEDHQVSGDDDAIGATVSNHATSDASIDGWTDGKVGVEDTIDRLPKESDSDSEHDEQVLSLTERLMQSHKKKKKDNKVNGLQKSEKRGKHQTGSSDRDFVVISSEPSSDEEDKENESTGRRYEDKPTFKKYRDETTPTKRYTSDSSSDDDDDKFENFLASIKSSQTPAKPASICSQDEMDDFIADDDEPIVISSDGEDDELFYYKCDNAETSVFPNEEEKSNNSSVYQSLLSDSANSDNYVTPASHLNTASKPVFKKPSAAHSSNILSDSDSESDDEFKTPMWEPRTAKKKATDVTKHWNVKASNKIPIKSKPLSTFLSGSKSDDSNGDDSVFVTPSVRPPLKPKNFKKPAYTLPAKPSRPVLNDHHHKSGGHGVRSTPSFLSALATPVKGEHSSSPYVKDFKKNKEALTQRLFKLYNETVFDSKLPSDLSITWNKRLRKTAGYCYYSKSKAGETRHSRIELSDKVCDSAERLRDTLIHELCHAAAWLVNGVHDGHGRYWKYWAAKANIAHPEIPVIKRCHSYEINTKYKYQCTRCSTTIGRHSKSINTEKFCCAHCKGQLILLPTINKDGTPSRARTPNKFALFVKENYASAKKDNAQLKHADIMRLLSKDFAGKAKIAE